MNTNKKNNGWILCPSQTFPGKFYYFNVSTGEAAWSLSNAEVKLKRDAIPKVNENYSRPEPSGRPTDLSKAISITPPSICRRPMKHPTPVFGQSAFPKPLQIKTEDPNVIWTPIQIQVPIVFAPEQGKNTDTKSISQIESPLQVGNEILVQTSDKPLCQRFINYEEPVINFNKYNKIKDIHQFEKFYTSTPIKTPELTPSSQKFQGANQPFLSDNLSFSDLSAKAHQRRLIKQSVYNIELPSDSDQVLCDTELQDSLQKLDLVKTSTSSLSMTPPIFGTQLHAEKPNTVVPTSKIISIPSETTSKKVDFVMTNLTPKPTHNLEATNFTSKESSNVMSTNNEMLKNFGDDLRTLLRAKRRNTGFKNDSNNSGSNNVRTMKQEIPATPKKKVSFKLDNEVSIIQNDFEYESLYDNHCSAQSLRNLAAPGTRVDQWCLVPDTGTLLEDFEFLDSFVKSDPLCRLLVPCSVVKDISAISVGESWDREVVTRARNIIRRLPNAHIILQSTDSVANLPKTKSILNCCIEAMDQNIHVILITSNSDLQSMALANSLQYYTIRQIKYGTAGRRIQDGGAGNEIKDGGQETKDTMPLDFKQMKITIQNVPERNNEQLNGGHSFRSNLFDIDDLNEREKEILRAIRSDSINENISVNDLNTSQGLSQFSKMTDTFQKPKFNNIHITIPNSKISSPNGFEGICGYQCSVSSDSQCKIAKDSTKLTYYANNCTESNTLIDKHSKPPMSLKWRNAPSDLSFTKTNMQYLNLKENTIPSHTNTTPETIDLEKHYSDETVSFYFQNDSPKFKNKSTPTIDAPIVSTYFPNQQTTSIFEPRETDCGINKKQSSIFEIDNEPIFELNEPEEPQNYIFKMGIDTSLYKVIDFKKSQSQYDSQFKKSETQPSKSNFKINEFQKPQTITTQNSNFKIGELAKPQTQTATHSQYNHRIKSNTSKPTELHSKFKIEDRIMPANGKKMDLSRFTVKSELIENRLKERIDEWMCSFIQIMEECMTGVLLRLSSSELKSMSPPWSLYEGLQITKAIYKEHSIIKNLADQLCGYLYEPDFQNDSLKKNISPSDFLKSIGYGIYLVKHLKNILQNYDGIRDTEEYLNKLLNNIEDPASDVTEPLIRTPVTAKLEDQIHKQNFVKRPSEIVNYLKNHYPEWKSYETADTMDENVKNVIRTLGKDINMLKLDKNAFIVSKDANVGQNISKNNVVTHVIKHKTKTDNNIDKEQTNTTKEAKINKQIDNVNTVRKKVTATCDNIAKTIVNNVRPINLNPNDKKAGNILTRTIEYNEMKVGNIAAKNKDIGSSKDRVISTKNDTKGTKMQLRRNNVANLGIISKDVEYRDKATTLSTNDTKKNGKIDDLRSDLNETVAKDIYINNIKLDRKTLGVKVTVPNDYTGNPNLETQFKSLDTEFDISNARAKNEKDDSGINNPKIIRNANLIEEYENRMNSKLDELDSSNIDYEGAGTAFGSNKDIFDFGEETSYSHKKFDYSREEFEEPNNLNIDDSTVDLNEYSESQNVLNGDSSNNYTVKNDLKSDSGFENDTSKLFSTVQSFSIELGSSLDFIHQFIDGSIEEFRTGRVGDETKAHFRLKAFEANFLVSKIIIRLTKLAHSELTDEKLSQNAEESSGNHNKYTDTVTQCLAQAQILQRTLNVILAVTNEN